MPTPDILILVIPGTMGTLAFERIGSFLYQIVVQVDYMRP